MRPPHGLNSLFVAAVVALSIDSAHADLGVPLTPAAPLNGNAAGTTGNFSPKIVADGHGHWLAVWNSDDSLGGTIGTDHDILLARSVDGGANWSLPAPLNSNAAGDQNSDFDPALATDGIGNWLAVWVSAAAMSDTDLLVARSIDNGANWSSPIALNTNAATDQGSDFVPAIATDGLGNWVVVWYSNENLGGAIGTELDILVSRSIDNGANWSNPIPLNTNAAGDTATDYLPKVVSDGAGHWVAAWGSSGVIGGTDAADNDILVSRSVDNGATWSAPAPLNANAFSDGNIGDFNVSLATDRLGNWTAVWETYDPATDATQIVAARSIDNGANWSSPVPVESPATGFYTSPGVATGGPGHWVAVWVWNVNAALDGPIAIRLARSIDNGQNWSTGSSVPGDAGKEPDEGNIENIATDGLGQWVAAWTSAQAGGSNTDILFTRFALPDCNSNLIGDPLETTSFLAPDINSNRIPDSCELPFIAPPGGCGGGVCGTGAAALAPLALFGYGHLRRSTRRRRILGAHPCKARTDRARTSRPGPCSSCA